VDGRHRSADDLELIVDNLGYWRQAVRCARSIGNNVMFGRIVLIVIHAHDNGDVFVLSRSRNDDLFHRATHVLLGIFCIGESSRGLDHNLRANGSPIQLRRVLLGKYADSLVVDLYAVPARSDVMGKIAQNRIVLKQVRESFRIGQIVNRYELQIRIIKSRTKNVTSDTPESIDADFYRHFASVEYENVRISGMTGVNN